MPRVSRNAFLEILYKHIPPSFAYFVKDFPSPQHLFIASIAWCSFFDIFCTGTEAPLSNLQREREQRSHIMSENEKATPAVAAASVPSSSAAASSQLEENNRKSVHSGLDVDIEEYFKGPMDFHHSKWPAFMRLRGSVLPKMIIPLTFVGAWATAITCIDHFVHSLSIEYLLLTVTGFVVGLALSFRSTTAYERYTEGRKYWAQLLLSSRNLARLIWVHVQERHAVSAELGRSDVLAKLAALNLLNAFAVSLKHRLRFEPSTEYPDLAPLLCNVRTLAGEADQAALREHKVGSWKAAGQVHFDLTSLSS